MYWKGKDYLKRALFFIVLAVIWVLWERGDLDSLLQFAGLLLVLYGFCDILVEIVAGMGSDTAGEGLP
jgi:hypothetical protein